MAIKIPEKLNISWRKIEATGSMSVIFAFLLGIAALIFASLAIYKFDVFPTLFSLGRLFART